MADSIRGEKMAFCGGKLDLVSLSLDVVEMHQQSRQFAHEMVIERWRTSHKPAGLLDYFPVL